MTTYSSAEAAPQTPTVLEPTPVGPVVLDEDTSAALMQQQDTAAALTRAVSTQSLGVAQGLGMLAAFDVMSQFTGFARAKWLMEMKESNAYKGAQAVMPGGELRVLKSFEDLCAAARVSVSKAKEDIQNIKLFGIEFMERAESAGLGYRDMRKLRALPEAERDMVLAEEKASNDPEILKEILEDFAEKNAQLKKKSEELQGTLDARNDVLKKKNDALDKAQTELAKLHKLPENARAAARAEMRKKAVAVLADACVKAVGGVVDVTAQAGALLASAREDVDSVSSEMCHRVLSDMCQSISDLLLDAGVDVDLIQILAGQMVQLAGQPAEADSGE